MIKITSKKELDTTDLLPTVIKVEEATLNLIKEALSVAKNYVVAASAEHLKTENVCANHHLFNKLLDAMNADVELIEKCEELLNK